MRGKRGAGQRTLVATAVAALALSLGACGSPPTLARAPAAEVTAPKSRLSGTHLLDLSEVPKDAICSYDLLLEEFCVKGLREAFEPSMTRIVAGFIDPAPRPRYTVILRIPELRHFAMEVDDLGRPVAARVQLRWQLIIKDNLGHDVLVVARATRSPLVLSRPEDGEPVIRALVGAMLLEITRVLESAPLHTAGATGIVQPSSR